MYINKKIIGIIPARYASTRLPAKPLADICGKPLIQWVYEGCQSSIFLDEVIIATDDERIADVCKSLNLKYEMTDKEIKTGSDRILTAYKNINEEYDYIINIQGDEPLINATVLDSLIKNTIEATAQVGTLISEISSFEDLINPNIVKVVLNHKSNAMYFSRQPIPYIRDIKPKNWLDKHIYYKHIGIYIFKTKTLEIFCNYEETKAEHLEKLEQLRLLENDIDIYCNLTDEFLYSIDTPENLEFINNYLKNNCNELS